MRYKSEKQLIEQMHSYDNDINNDHAFGGHILKSVVRINDNCPSLRRKREHDDMKIKKTLRDSLFFRELFKSLMSKESYYKTYLNELFNVKKKSEIHIPDNISCFVKNIEESKDLCYIPDVNETCYYECVGSRLANLMGVDTVFNIAVKSMDNIWFYDRIPNFSTIVSVDYVPFGYKEVSLSELDIDFDENTCLDVILERIEKKWNDFSKQYNLENSPEKFRQIKEKFALQYLFRNLMCEDYDFAARNASILVGDNGDFRLAPCYDMEQFFWGKRESDYYRRHAKENIKYLLDNMPHVLKSFMSRYCEVLHNGQLENVVKNSLKVDQIISDRTFEHVCQNFIFLQNIMSEMMFDNQFEKDN